MATTPAVLTLEEYLQTTYKPDCDFVDDHIEERTWASSITTGCKFLQRPSSLRMRAYGK